MRCSSCGVADGWHRVSCEQSTVPKVKEFEVPKTKIICTCGSIVYIYEDGGECYECQKSF